MGYQTCCVPNFKNSARNSNSKFYIFPLAKWKLEQRNKWIDAVR